MEYKHGMLNPIIGVEPYLKADITPKLEKNYFIFGLFESESNPRRMIISTRVISFHSENSRAVGGLEQQIHCAKAFAVEVDIDRQKLDIHGVVSEIADAYKAEDSINPDWEGIENMLGSMLRDKYGS
ncbi:hypothetical protein HYX10_06160 [Candidatus Woesearchaeota archaeon]|nr:hypothetical protein [Candidatus Woesearchaeota archaeon]